MGGKDADNSLILLLAQLRNNDEDSKKRKRISHTLSKAQCEKYRKIIRKNRDDHLFPVDRFYIRTDRKTGKKYLVRSRRIHSDNLVKSKKGAFRVKAGSII